jgi:uncharacterized protein YuzE
MSLVPTYDPAVDALYLCARPGVSVDTTVELDPRVIVDRDADGVAVGVELLSAARHGIPTGLLAKALGTELAGEQEIADAALRAIRGRPSAAEPD